MNMSANNAWITALYQIMEFGQEISPRGMLTKEISPNLVTFDMNRPICFHPERKLSYKFMAAEAYWIISGSMFAEDITPYNKFIGQFSDDQYIFNGNYGVPFANQLEYVVQALITDADTRQAALTIWRPNPIKSKDYPCTISLVFSIRNNKINTFVKMRSSDGWLGLPYDMFNFTAMTIRVLTRYHESGGLDLSLGNMHMFLVSSHLYERNFEDVAKVLESNQVAQTSKVPDKVLKSWPKFSASLLACRDMIEPEIIHKRDLWRIRP